MSKRYINIDEIFLGITEKYDAIIVGSDQVWNPYIAETYGRAYWLPSSINVNKIAYAVSLGCAVYPTDLLNKLSIFINDFNYISVRENSAIDIIQSVYRKNTVFYAPDPVVLPSIDVYLKLINKNKCPKGCFIYTLQDKQKLIKNIELLIQKNFRLPPFGSRHFQSEFDKLYHQFRL